MPESLFTKVANFFPEETEETLNTVVSVGPMQKNLIYYVTTMDARENAILFDGKISFWVNLVQKIKIVSFSRNLVPKLIRICTIQQWCLFFLL